MNYYTKLHWTNIGCLFRTIRVLDLSDLKRIVQEAVIERVDHHNLNEVLPCRTTVENIAHWIWHQLSPTLGDLLCRLRLWETATSYVEVKKEDV